MYLRFIAPRALRRVQADAGLFGPAYAYRNWQGTPYWLRRALAEEIDWFEWHLPVPDKFGIRTRKSRRDYAGICWFRSDAEVAVQHAWTLALLLGEAGVPISTVHTSRPGQIVYRDPMQIVALPRAETPVRWH